MGTNMLKSFTFITCKTNLYSIWRSIKERIISYRQTQGSDGIKSFLSKPLPCFWCNSHFEKSLCKILVHAVNLFGFSKVSA